MFDIQKMMKQAQEMQGKMEKVQEELEGIVVTGTAGGGAVKITCNCKYEFSKVEISPDAMGDADLLNDMVLMALNDACHQVQKVSEEKMGAVTSGMNIPGLKLPKF